MKTTIPAVLEIDHNRGVVYVHLTEEGMERFKAPTAIRIQGLPTPVPEIRKRMLDMNLANGWCDWPGEEGRKDAPRRMERAKFCQLHEDSAAGCSESRWVGGNYGGYLYGGYVCHNPDHHRDEGVEGERGPGPCPTGEKGEDGPRGL